MKRNIWDNVCICGSYYIRDIKGEILGCLSENCLCYYENFDEEEKN